MADRNTAYLSVHSGREAWPEYAAEEVDYSTLNNSDLIKAFAFTATIRDFAIEETYGVEEAQADLDRVTNELLKRGLITP